MSTFMNVCQYFIILSVTKKIALISWMRNLMSWYIAESFITLDHKVETSKLCEKYILKMLINYCFMKRNVISFLSWNDENNISSFKLGRDRNKITQRKVVILEILVTSNQLWLLSSFFYSKIKSRRSKQRIRIKRTNFILYMSWVLWY